MAEDRMTIVRLRLEDLDLTITVLGRRDPARRFRDMRLVIDNGPGGIATRGTLHEVLPERIEALGQIDPGDALVVTFGEESVHAP